MTTEEQTRALHTLAALLRACDDLVDRVPVGAMDPEEVERARLARDDLAWLITDARALVERLEAAERAATA